MVNDVNARSQWLTPVLIALGVGVLVTALGLVIKAEPAIAAAELRLLASFDLRHAPVPNAVALALNYGIGPVGAAVVAVLASVIVGAVLRSWREGVRFAVLIAVPWLAVSIVKLLVERPRPDMAALADVLVPLPGSTSFPSGHTAFAAALGCALIVTVARFARRRGTVVLVVVLAAIFALVTAWSRMYLGVHQPTDVAASLVFVPVASWATARVLAARDRST